MPTLWTGPLDTLVLVDAAFYPRLIADLAMMESAHSSSGHDGGSASLLAARRKDVWEQARWRGQVLLVAGVRAMEVHTQYSPGDPPLVLEATADALPALPPYRQWVVVVGNAQGWWGTGAVCTWTSTLLPPCRPDDVPGLRLRFSGHQRLPQATMVPPPATCWTSADTHLRLICPQPLQRLTPGSDGSWLLQFLAPTGISLPNFLLLLMPNPWPLMWMRILSPQVLEFCVKLDPAFRGRMYFELHAEAGSGGPRTHTLLSLEQF